MRKLLALSFCLLASTALAQQTKTQLNTEINTQLPDNVQGLITPSILRGVLHDMVNSSVTIADPNTVTGVPLIIATPTDDQAPGATPVPTRLGVYNGSNATPVTANNKMTALFTKIENIPTAATEHSSIVLVEGFAHATSKGQMQGVTTYIDSFTADADAVAFFGVTGSSGKGAFGAYFEARANGATASSIAIETANLNNSGVSTPWASLVLGGQGQVGLDVTGGGNANLTAGALIRANAVKWDVGYGVWTNSVQTAAFISPGFAVDPTGVVTTTKSYGANTSGDGLVLRNTTAATAGNQQKSPRIHLIGQGWKTDATASSQQVEWTIEDEPFQGTAFPIPFLVFRSQINNGGFLTIARLQNDGQSSFYIGGDNALAQVLLNPSNSSVGVFLGDTTQIIFGSLTNIPVKFYSNSTEKMRLHASGGLSVGAGIVGTDPGAGNIAGIWVQTATVAVASLPTCNAAAEGARMGVNNSNAASFTAGIGAVVAGGGTTHVPVYCDGTNWRIG